MSNKLRKNLILTGLTILIVIIMSFIYVKLTSKSNTFNKDNIAPDGNKKVFEENINNLSAWATYWDLNCDKEIIALDKELKNLCYFAVSFNGSNELVMPDKLINYYNQTKSLPYTKYMTIVNDKTNSDGSSLLKDTTLLKALLSDSDSRNKHAEDLINLAVKYNFDGIEIDYEQIKDDLKLWKDYRLFIKDLYKKAEKQGLKVRVVLQPNIPFDKLTFDEGPTYVMMCYNLHGGFSKPGEKANPKFISGLIEKMSKIPGKKDFAIATGGFNWAANGKTTSLTETEANNLLKEYNAKAERDKESQCLVFKYTDKDNRKHEVWYADKTTLKSWTKVIAEKGYDVSLWRLGGNCFR